MGRHFDGNQCRERNVAVVGTNQDWGNAIVPYSEILKDNSGMVFNILALRFGPDGKKSACQLMGKRREWLANLDGDKVRDSQMKKLSQATPLVSSEGEQA